MAKDLKPMINLDEIERRAAAATAGPWTVEPYDYGAAVRGGCLLAECMQAATSKHATDVQECRKNAAFIAAARVDVPALIARVRELEAERDEARAEVERLRREVDEMAAELHALSVKYDANANDTADAYRRGAEAMREACIGAACGFFMGTTGFRNGDEDELEAVLEALPIPEEP